MRKYSDAGIFFFLFLVVNLLLDCLKLILEVTWLHLLKSVKTKEKMVSSEEVKRRVAFVLIDGVGDVSLPRFGYKTPLQVANIPNLDAIASAGINGLMDPVEAGLGCGSDTAHLSLLGYDPRLYYRGRGAFESMGAGLAMSPGDIAFKVCAHHVISNFYSQTWTYLTLILCYYYALYVTYCRV